MLVKTKELLLGN